MYFPHNAIFQDLAFNMEMRQQHADALLVLEEPVLGVHANRIAELAAKDRLPTVFAPSRVSAGGLLSYGVSQTEAIRMGAAKLPTMRL